MCWLYGPGVVCCLALFRSIVYRLVLPGCVCAVFSFHQLSSPMPPCHVPCVHAELQFLRDGYSVCVDGSHAYLVMALRRVCARLCLSFVCHVTSFMVMHACDADMFVHACMFIFILVCILCLSFECTCSEVHASRLITLVSTEFYRHIYAWHAR